MFRGFIVLGVAFTVGYTKGYLKGQNHTKELATLLQEIRDSEATEKLITDLGDALARFPKVEDEPEEGDTEGSSNGDSHGVVEYDAITSKTTEGE